jgi:dsRNA-specific ribonuclease
MKYIKTSADRQLFKKAMTHESWYEDGNVGNSRYVFTGMFVFRGKVGEILAKWIPVKGQVLQHILGNHFSKNRLHEMYENLSLSNYVRVGKGFDVNKHKHVFVYSWLGFLYEIMDDDALMEFITRNFLDEKIIGGATQPQQNPWQQLVFLSKMKFESSPKIVHTVDEASHHVVTIILNDEEFSTHVSKSKEYAKKSAIEKALKTIASEEEQLLSDFLHSIKEKERQHIEEVKRRAHNEFLSENLRKKAERKKIAAKLKAEKEEKEKRRRNAKQRVLKAKERRKESSIVITAGMNAAKRRRLEDKLK